MPVLEVLRVAVLALLVFSTGAALGSWAVRTRRINPFGPTARAVQRLTDPVLSPLETWLLRRGGNPQQAPWWLLGMTILAGIIVISGAQWLAGQISRVAGAASGGPRGVLRLLVYYAGQIVLIALIARVVGSWLGAGRYNRWLRPAYVLTDWIVRPLQRIIPPIGMIDITPVAAWFLLQLVLSWILRLI